MTPFMQGYLGVPDQQQSPYGFPLGLLGAMQRPRPLPNAAPMFASRQAPTVVPYMPGYPGANSPADNSALLAAMLRGQGGGGGVGSSLGGLSSGMGGGGKGGGGSTSGLLSSLMGSKGAGAAVPASYSALASGFGGNTIAADALLSAAGT